MSYIIYNTFTWVILKLWTPGGSASNSCSTSGSLEYLWFPAVPLFPCSTSVSLQYLCFPAVPLFPCIALFLRFPEVTLVLYCHLVPSSASGSLQYFMFLAVIWFPAVPLVPYSTVCSLQYLWFPSLPPFFCSTSVSLQYFWFLEVSLVPYSTLSRFPEVPLCLAPTGFGSPLLL